MQVRRFSIVMFVHKNMSWMRFDFQKPIAGLDLDIEDTYIFFYPMNVGVPWRKMHYHFHYYILFEIHTHTY